MAYNFTSMLEKIALGQLSGYTPWSKMGYSGAIGTTGPTTQSDIWSAGGLYTFPTAHVHLVVVGGANDDGTGPLYTGTSTGGSTTSLIDTGKNFTAPTPVSVGDCIILAKGGDSSTAALTPEWGYVTSLTSTDQINVAGGFSSGGNASGRTYDVIQKALSTGAQAVKVSYLDTTFAQKEEIIITNGIAEVALAATDLYRVNSFRVIAAGSGGAADAALSLKVSGGTTYSYISAGYTRARNAMYTVPSGKVLFVTQVTLSYGTQSTNKIEYARIWVKANIVDSTSFILGNTSGTTTSEIFWPYIETVCSNSEATLPLPVYAKLPAKADIKVTGVASAVGSATVVMRGFLQTI